MSGGLTSIEVESGVWRITDPGYGRLSHSYLVLGAQRAGLIDTGTGFWDIRAEVASITQLDIVVLQTHAHPDHAGGSSAFQLVMAHPLAHIQLNSGWSNQDLRFTLDRHRNNATLPPELDPEVFMIPGCERIEHLENRGVVDLGGRQLDVFFTPGHSPDSVCFLDLDSGLLFTGDSVLKGRIAIENSRAYRRSIGEITRLAALAKKLYPAHGETPIEPEFSNVVRRGFSDAISDRHPVGHLAGFAAFEFDDFGILLPPRRRRLQEE